MESKAKINKYIKTICKNEDELLEIADWLALHSFVVDGKKLIEPYIGIYNQKLEKFIKIYDYLSMLPTFTITESVGRKYKASWEQDVVNYIKNFGYDASERIKLFKNHKQALKY